jgi:hypothetical protein
VPLSALLLPEDLATRAARGCKQCGSAAAHAHHNHAAQRSGVAVAPQLEVEVYQRVGLRPAGHWTLASHVEHAHSHVLTLSNTATWAVQRSYMRRSALDWAAPEAD